MALSEQERNILEQFEKQFKKDDPEFADAMEAGPARKHSRARAHIGVLTALSGIPVLLFGASLSNPTTGIIVGILGFAALIAGGYLTAPRSDRTGSKAPTRARQVSDRMLEQPYRLRNGDGIPNSHLWWF